MKITFLVSGSIQSNFSYRALTLARFLSKLGHEVSIIAPSADKYNNFIPTKADDIDGVKILYPFQFIRRRAEIDFLPYLFGAIRLLLRERPQVIYVYKPTPLSIVGLLGRLLRKTLVIVDFDDLGAEVMRIEGHPPYQRKLVEYSERCAARWADRMVVASTYLYKIYTVQYPRKPMHMMPNGVEPSWFGPTMPSDESKRIVFMGSINRKGILDPLFDVMPEITQRYQDAKLLIIGDVQFLEYFKDRVVKQGLTDYVTFTGWLPIEQARERLYASDIGYCVMPQGKATSAASYMKVPQYMARGVVPLVSDVGDLRLTIENGAAGYFCRADDVALLKDVLLRALEDPKRFEKAQRARKYSEDALNWSHLAEDFERWLS